MRTLLIVTLLALALPAAAGARLIVGTAADDVIVATAGRDIIDPGKGVDRLRARQGNDLIRTLDGVRDAVRCGRGYDEVIADQHDWIAPNCECFVRERI